jgi:hypothetical protein
MAGFEVIMYGRFWVIAKAPEIANWKNITPVAFRCVFLYPFSPTRPIKILFASSSDIFSCCWS